MAELQTHYELVCKQIAYTPEMAYLMHEYYEKATGQRFDIREVAE